MNHRDIAVLMDGIAPVLRGYVEKAFEPIGQRMLALERRFNDLPAARDGKDADPVLILRLVEQVVASVPPPEFDVVGEVDRAVVKRVSDAMADVHQRIADTPSPKDGMDADPEVIRQIVREEVAKVSPPTDGKDADPELIAKLVDAAVAALPPARNGEPGPAGVGVTVDQLAPLVSETVAREVEKLVLPIGPAGEKGERGEDGRSPDVGDLAPIVAEAVAVAAAELKEIAAALPAGKDGAPGERGEPGKSVAPEDLAPLVDQVVLRRIGELPSAKDGIDGREGVPGRDGRDGIPGLQGERGSDGRDGIDGQDGFGIDDFEVKAADDGRIIEFAFIREGADPIIKQMSAATVLDRGVWREKDYAKGDGVTWGGSFFIAQRDTSDKPETSDAWRLSVKRGRDGASAFDVARKAGFKGSEREWLDSLRPKPVQPVKVG